MTYALIVNGSVAQYPYNFARLRADNPQVSFPADPADAHLEQWGVVKVQPTGKPQQTITQNVVELTPVNIGGVWTQTWAMVAASAEETAQRQKAANDDAAKAEVKADAFIANFITLTPTQVATYVDNNTATLATMRALVKKLALVTLTLAKKEFSD